MLMRPGALATLVELHADTYPSVYLSIQKLQQITTSLHHYISK